MKPVGNFVREAALEAGVRMSVMAGPRRDARLARPRQKHMVRAWLEGHTPGAVGRAFGRDRTTVLFAIRKFEGGLPR